MIDSLQFIITNHLKLKILGSRARRSQVSSGRLTPLPESSLTFEDFEFGVDAHGQKIIFRWLVSNQRTYNAIMGTGRSLTPDAYAAVGPPFR